MCARDSVCAIVCSVYIYVCVCVCVRNLCNQPILIVNFPRGLICRFLQIFRQPALILYLSLCRYVFAHRSYNVPETMRESFTYAQTQVKSSYIFFRYEATSIDRKEGATFSASFSGGAAVCQPSTASF